MRETMRLGVACWLSCLLCATLPACSPKKRDPLAPGELEARQRAYPSTLLETRMTGADTLIRRMKREHDESASLHSGDRPTVDILILSGGGAKGAFGSGFLRGWGSVSDGPIARPEFDVVTGVSTGALIAPFAFVGTPDAYDAIDALYRHPGKNWVKRKAFFFSTRYSSMMNIRGLEADIRASVNGTIVEGLADGAANDRVLMVAATNLDLGMMHAWDLGREALERDGDGAAERVHELLLASIAMPGAFPPVEIDGDLHVDGGASEQILVLGDPTWEHNPIHRWTREYPDLPLPLFRVWVVINNKLRIDAERTKLSWVAIARRSLENMMDASLRSTMLRLEHAAEVFRDAGLESELRWVAIPDDFEIPKGKMFDQEKMLALSDLGRRMGADPSSWHTEVPQIVW